MGSRLGSWREHRICLRRRWKDRALHLLGTTKLLPSKDLKLNLTAKAVVAEILLLASALPSVKLFLEHC
ncbi:hypothetical protein Bca101_062671 [Brassica carinata]